MTVSKGINNFMSNSFKQFIKQSKEINKDVPSNTPFIDEIVEMAKMMYNENKTLSPEQLNDMAADEVLKNKTNELLKQIHNSSFSSLDIIKKICPMVEL